MKDDAVAPVVAAMLLLAVIVTVFAAWNAIVLPSLKDQSEILQDHEVRDALVRFSSDLGTAASLKRDLMLSESLPLGGGDVLIDPLLSAGTLRVNPGTGDIYNVTVVSGGSTYIVNGSLVNISYRPVGDFWLDQGYTWHYGYLNVTRSSSPHGADGAALSAPLSSRYPTMEGITRSPQVEGLAASLAVAGAEPYSNSSTNASRVTIASVTFRPEDGVSHASGNGIATLTLAASVRTPPPGFPANVNPESVTVYFSNASDAPLPFRRALYRECNQSFAELNATYPGNIEHLFDRESMPPRYTGIRKLAGGLPFNLTYRQADIRVSVQ